MKPPSVHHGIVSGETIVLTDSPGLPDGQEVRVTLEVVRMESTDDGLRRAFGAWAEDADELDEYLRWNREQRKSTGCRTFD